MLKSGVEVASKYRVDDELPAENTRPAYLATVKDTEQRVLMFVLAEEESAALGALAGVEHAHLAKVIELASLPTGEAVLVLEHIAGQTLEQHLASEGKLTPLEAVRLILRVADALSKLHQAGAVHGFVRPASIISAPEEGHPSPMLGFAPPLKGASPYRLATRAEEGSPSEADDAWAAAGLFYELLTGKPPPPAGLQTADELEALGVQDEALRAALAHGLAADEAERSQDVTALKRELARWFVYHAGDEDAHVSKTPSTAPPPLPPTSAPLSVAAARAAAPSTRTLPPRRMRRLLLLAGVALPLGVGAAWAVSALLGSREVVVEIPKESGSAAAAPSASASAPSIDLSEVPVTSESEVATGDKMATCVAGYLPKGAFARKAPNLSWLCSQPDPRVGGRKLRVAVVFGGGGRTTKAMKLVSKLGWYQMAAYSVVYAGCCVDSEPLKLPDPSPDCPRMDEPLISLGRQVVAERNHEESLKQLGDAIACEARAKRAKLYRQKRKPKAREQRAFKDLVEALRAP